MKKAMLIIILSAMLTACGTTENTVKEEPTAVTSAVSRTTTTAAETASKAGASLETTTTTAVTTSTSKTTTSKAETSISKSTTKKSVSETTTTRQLIQQTEAQTYIVYYDEPAPETQQMQSKVKVTETTTTTVQTTPPTATATSPPTTTTTAAASGVEWSDSMKVWRKLCEGQGLSGSEQDIIRNEILDYAVNSFDGKKDIHVSFGIDSYDISYEKPLKLTVRPDMTDMSCAHMDAHTDPVCKRLIDYASSEQKIYDIVSDTRQSCLHLIDQGLFNRWEIFSACGQLKYASDIEFNVGFDEDGALWFLTED